MKRTICFIGFSFFLPKIRQLGIRFDGKNGKCRFKRGNAKVPEGRFLIDNPAQASAQCGETAVSSMAARRDAHLQVGNSAHLSELPSLFLRCRALTYPVINKESSLRDFRTSSLFALHLLISNWRKLNCKGQSLANSFTYINCKGNLSRTFAITILFGHFAHELLPLQFCLGVSLANFCHYISAWRNFF